MYVYTHTHLCREAVLKLHQFKVGVIDCNGCISDNSMQGFACLIQELSQPHLYMPTGDDRLLQLSRDKDRCEPTVACLPSKSM